MHSHRGFPLVEVFLIAGVVGLVALLAIPALFTSSHHHHERNFSSSLKTLSSAEADFRANDRDWNHVNDFWTGDVKSLYTLTSAGIRGAGTDPQDMAIRLIEQSVALADADPTFLPAAGENMKLDRFGPS